jgi:Rrf2 family protein
MHLEVSKKTDLALRAMTHLHQVGRVSPGPELAVAIDTTISYLPQILRPLILADWIAATPGPGGGYRLTAGLGDLSVLNVIETVEGETTNDRCVLRGTPCPVQEQCALHTSWVRARGALLAELDSTSLDAALGSAPTKGE